MSEIAEMSGSRVLMSPAMAQEIIAADTKFLESIADPAEREKHKNRPLKHHRVALFQAIIAADKWVETPEPVAVCWNGRMIDGQHRVHAIAKGEKSVWVFLIINCKEESFGAMGRGVPRSLADANRIPAWMAGIGRFLCCISRGRLTSDRAPDYMVMRTIEPIRTEIELAHDAAKTKNKTGSVPIWSAGVMQLLFNPVSLDYVTTTLRQMNKFDSASPPIVLALLRQVSSGKASARDQIDLFARAFHMLEFNNRNDKTIRISDEESRLIVERCKVKLQQLTGNETA